MLTFEYLCVTFSCKEGKVGRGRQMKHILTKGEYNKRIDKDGMNYGCVLYELWRKVIEKDMRKLWCAPEYDTSFLRLLRCRVI